MRNIIFFLNIVLCAPQAFCSTGQFEAAETYLKERDFDRASEKFLAFYEAQPEHEDAPLALYTAARIRMIVQNRSQEGATLFRKLLDEYPHNEWAYHGAVRLAERALEQEDSLLAATSYEKAVQIGEEIFPPVSEVSDALFRAHKTCGDIYLNLRQYEKAEPYYARLLETSIHDRRAMPEIYSQLAACYEGEDRGTLAAEIYLDLIKTYPTSRQASGLCETREKIDPYFTFDWEPYEYFVDGYTAFRTWPAKAAEHIMNLEDKGASAELVQTGLSLLPWVYYYAFDFEKARQAHADYLSRYPDDTSDPYVQYFPMYLDSYREEFEFKGFLTSVSFLIAETDTTLTLTPEEEYATVSRSNGWKVMDLTPHFGVYNQLLFVDRPLNRTDVAYVRVFVKPDHERGTHLEVDSDDPWTVWLNGDCLGQFTGSPGTASLNPISGWNEVLVKLTQREGGMTATFRFVDDVDELEREFVYRAIKK